MGYGGDTLNTAIYLARLGVSVGYMTALGQDAWSADLKSQWIAEGVDAALTLAHPTRLPGIYAISTDAKGERSFAYWREQSAARVFFATSGADEAVAIASRANVLYLSGISLAILDANGREKALQLARRVRAQGGSVAFDPNYRARLWSSPGECQKTIAALAPSVSIALPSFDDETALWGDADAAITLQRWAQLGADAAPLNQQELPF